MLLWFLKTSWTHHLDQRSSQVERHNTNGRFFLVYTLIYFYTVKFGCYTRTFWVSLCNELIHFSTNPVGILSFFFGQLKCVWLQGANLKPKKQQDQTLLPYCYHMLTPYCLIIAKKISISLSICFNIYIVSNMMPTFKPWDNWGELQEPWLYRMDGWMLFEMVMQRFFNTLPKITQHADIY